MRDTIGGRPPSLTRGASLQATKRARRPDGASRRHRGRNTRDPVLVNSQRVNENNKSTIGKLVRRYLGIYILVPTRAVPVATPLLRPHSHKKLIIFLIPIIFACASPNRRFCSTWRAFSRSPAPRLRAKSRATPFALDMVCA